MNGANEQTLWSRLIGVLIFVIVGMAGGWLFFTFQNTDFTAYGFSGMPNRFGQIKKLEDTTTQKQQELDALKKSQEAVKYDNATHIETKIEHPLWSAYINSLIEMYVQVRSIGKYATDAIELSDFVVDQKTISLRGKVRKLDTIYQENGVIDRITKLDFINNVEIPSYQKVDDVYEFQIQGEVRSSGTPKEGG